MSILTSNIKPLYFKENQNIGELFQILADNSYSDLLKISVGYISIDSITYLLENIRRDNINNCELTIGMHSFSGFTKNLYEATLVLDRELRERKKGFINICTVIPYHGKTYSFWKNNKAFAAIVGSSNLDSILYNDHLDYEVDLFSKDQEIVNQISDLQYSIDQKITEPFNTWMHKEFIKSEIFPPDYRDIEKLSESEIKSVWEGKKSLFFDLELKTEQKSNLNCIAGKGRENKRTKIIRPRSWYEIEIIVGSDITSKKEYPKYSEFRVITNDGYCFTCQTQGDYSKNFRSKNDLRILGFWIKGQMVDAGVIQVGELVTQETLDNFGKKYIRLQASNVPNTWLIKLI
jgi:HKD family nuclease